MRPRSGLAAKHGVTVLNSPGTVDADYRGEINVLLINHGDAPFPIRRGERIAQMVIAPVVQAELVPARIAVGDRPRQRRLRFDRALTKNSVKNTEFVRKIRFAGSRRAFFTGRFTFTIWTLTRRLPMGILSSDSRTAGVSAGPAVVRFGANHVGRSRGDASKPAVVHLTGAPRPDRARHHADRVAGTRACRRFDRHAGDFGLARPQSPGIRGADHGAGAARLFRGGRDPADAHPRPRTRTEVRLRADIADLQVQADRLRALLFAEPQILISWAAGDNRPQISGDTSLLISQDALQNSPQRILAFGTWLPPEPALQMDHAVDALREAGEGFLLNLSTSNGRAIEAMGRAIGGQAIVRIRELGGLRRELAESNLRYKTLQEETELLRDFAAAAPWPIWAKSAEGNLRYANAAYVRATEGASVADAIHRNLELLDSDQRTEMSRALNDNASFTARLPIVVGGERRIYDVQALKLGGGSAGIAIDASEADRAARRAGADGGGASPHPRPVVVGRRRVRRPAAARLLQRILPPAVGPRPGLPRRQSRQFQRARPAARRAQTAGAAGLPRLEGQAARGLSRGRTGDLHLVPARRPRASASSPRRISKAASPICSTTSPRASIWRGGSTG